MSQPPAGSPITVAPLNPGLHIELPALGIWCGGRKPLLLSLLSTVAGVIVAGILIEQHMSGTAHSAGDFVAFGLAIGFAFVFASAALLAAIHNGRSKQPTADNAGAIAVCLPCFDD